MASRLASTNSSAAPGAAVRAAFAGRQQPAWPEPLHKCRQQALEHFCERGLPDTRNEAWRHTDLKEYGLRLADYLAGAEKPAAPDSIAREIPAGLADGPLLRFVDGQWAGGSRTGLPGLTISRLNDRDHAKRCSSAITELAASQGLDALGALNLALLDDALLIEVAAGADLEHPIHLELAGSGARRVQQLRVIVRLGQDSQASLVISQRSHGPALSGLELDLHCAPGAKLRCLRLQQEDGQALHRTASRFQLDEKAALDYLSLDLGAALARNETLVRLSGRGASARLLGLQVVDGQRHVDNRSCLEHIAPAAHSNERFHSIVDDHGHGVFNGAILVHPEAAGTDARLNNRNLLLAATAEVDTKPELEIYTDDVKCAHGATTGQLDNAALFYLRSRGITAAEARQMLMQAFAHQILDEAGWPQLADWLGEQLAAALPDSPGGLAR